MTDAPLPKDHGALDTFSDGALPMHATLASRAPDAGETEPPPTIAEVLDWAASLATLEDPRTSDWRYDDPHDLAKAIRKGPDDWRGLLTAKTSAMRDGLLALSHQLDDAAQGICESRAYEFATQMRVLLGLDGDTAPHPVGSALTAADLPPHPDAHSMAWSESEKRAILLWGQSLAAAPAPAEDAVSDEQLDAVFALVNGPFVTRAEQRAEARRILALRSGASAQPDMPKLFAGLLFDFGGFLTTHERRWTFSSRDDAGAMVEAIREFAAKRGLSLDDPSIRGWTGASALPADAEHERLLKAERERDRLHALVNSPQTKDFLSAVAAEKAHQIERWGEAHDRGKSAENWFWLVGYLAGKCLRACITGDREKALHHTISSAAALANWHEAIKRDETGTGLGHDNDIRPVEIARFDGSTP